MNAKIYEKKLDKFVVLIGSYARGKYDQHSDCDVLRVNFENTTLDCSKLPVTDTSIVSCIDYDNDTFYALYGSGSLFLYHAFHEGKLIFGDTKTWKKLKHGFVVQKDFSKELQEISMVTEFLSDIEIFGGKFLTPLVNAFTELKNASIFFLAHQGIYVFDKEQCIRTAIPNSKILPTLISLKKFYDYSARCQDLELPFDPNSAVECKDVLLEVHRVTLGMRNACT